MGCSSYKSGDTPEEFQKALRALYSSIASAINPDNEDSPESDISRSNTMSEITPLAQEDGRQALLEPEL